MAVDMMFPRRNARDEDGPIAYPAKWHQGASGREKKARGRLARGRLGDAAELGVEERHADAMLQHLRVQVDRLVGGAALKLARKQEQLPLMPPEFLLQPDA